MHNLLPQNIWPFIWHFLKSYKKIMVLYITLALLAGCWGPFNSLLIKYIINILALSHNPDTSILIFPAILLVVNFIIFDNITWRTIGYLNYKFQPVIKNKIIGDTFHFTLSASHQFFNDNLSGRIASHINTLADNIERILHHISADFIRGFSLLTIALFTTYYINPTFFYILAFASFSITMSKRLVTLSDIHTQAESIVSGQLVDSIANNNNVRIFASAKNEVSHLKKSLIITQKTFQIDRFEVSLLGKITS